ncbi:MAG: glycosyltransferase [Methanoregula sp.]|jgi:cellulose synthase/poly-beta-1,6-N-acetylglucosamine synthase-like glycosyltransferase|nr:glycosyltransferase [Methanoregula sp.]PKL63733.1 MAG: glycosyl transferase family 2 [Methanomicrobiales archaeon HGW-Methanomicrobiales-3]
MFLVIGIALLIIALSPYGVYLLGISFGKKSTETSFPDIYPQITMIMSAFNEESVVEARVANLMQCHYPKDACEIIFIDDFSSDQTLPRAKACLEKSGFEFTLIANPERLGTNRSYNHAMKRARYPIIVTTDADVFFEPDSLNYLTGRLMSDPAIAAVTGELSPRKNENNTTKLEGAYRSYYGRMCDWESAVDSTYNFNGALVAFRTDLIRRIDDKRGSDDANTAFEAIRKGYRAVYERRAMVFEDIPSSFSVQYRQKIRRAKRLIEATLANLDLLGMNRPFTRLFYPLRLFMCICTPTLFFTSLLFIAAGLYSAYPLVPLVLACLVVIVGIIWRENLLNAFVVNQFYLFVGLLNMGKDTRIWDSTSKKENS